jgi:hypothetical protein
MHLCRPATSMKQGIVRPAPAWLILCAPLLVGLGTGCQRDAEPAAPGANAPYLEATAQARDADADPPANARDAEPEVASSQQRLGRPNGRFAEELRYAKYAIDALATGEARLDDGVYEAEVAGSGPRNMVRLAPATAFGDLNGDGVEDAAVALLVTPGGSGSFTYVAAVINADGDARPTNAVLIGDRVALQSVRVVDGEIHVSWMDRKPSDPMTTKPATPVSTMAVVEQGKLVVRSDR